LQSDAMVLINIKIRGCAFFQSSCVNNLANLKEGKINCN